MPNGFHGSERDWRQIEAPLQQLDTRLASFARTHGMTVTRNEHSWPDRSLVWGDPVRRLIQIYPAIEDALTYNVWICASEYRNGKRYWKQSFLKEAVPIGDIDAELDELLERGRSVLDGWESGVLELAG